MNFLIVVVDMIMWLLQSDLANKQWEQEVFRSQFFNSTR